MTDNRFVVAENRRVAKDTYYLWLEGAHAFTAPGQFAQLDISGLFLRRPISVLDYDDAGFSMVFKVAGQGTGKLAQLAVGDEINCLTGLGNGFDASRAKKPLLLGGGVGVPPLFGLAKRFANRGAAPEVLLGFNAEEDVFYKDEFASLGCRVRVATVCDSCYTKGLITALIPSCGDYDFYYACGPEAMLRAVSESCQTQGQLSLESRMACGFGACVGCSKKTKTGYKRVCKDGPVFESGDILW